MTPEPRPSAEMSVDELESRVVRPSPTVDGGVDPESLATVSSRERAHDCDEPRVRVVARVDVDHRAGKERRPPVLAGIGRDVNDGVQPAAHEPGPGTDDACLPNVHATLRSGNVHDRACDPPRLSPVGGG